MIPSLQMVRQQICTNQSEIKWTFPVSLVGALDRAGLMMLIRKPGSPTTDLVEMDALTFTHEAKHYMRR